MTKPGSDIIHKVTSVISTVSVRVNVSIDFNVISIIGACDGHMASSFEINSAKLSCCNYAIYTKI